ncbi:MAG: hypothetical protein ACYCSN_14595 [Acidobacteriaceae bacterium]
MTERKEYKDLTIEKTRDFSIMWTPGGRKGRVFDSLGRLVFVGNREAVDNYLAGFADGKRGGEYER